MKKQMMEKGITLVALIITIVILIILAVVAITTIMNTDILGYADNSANIYENKKAEEQETMQGYEDYLAGNKRKLFKLVDVPETVTEKGTYSVKNGVLKASVYDNGYWNNFYDYKDAGVGFSIPFECSLKSGASYEFAITGTFEVNGVDPAVYVIVNDDIIGNVYDGFVWSGESGKVNGYISMSSGGGYMDARIYAECTFSLVEID